jgi:aerobic C4-dicarboxylate transport protein
MLDRTLTMSGRVISVEPMHPEPTAGRATPTRRRRDTLYLQVLVAITLGVLVGYLRPAWGVALQPLGDGFIKLIKLLIAPLIFATVVAGIAGMGDLKRIGRVGVKALIYFEVVTTAALIIGLVVINVFKPGVGMHVNASALDTKDIAGYLEQGKKQSIVEFLLNIIPRTFVGAFAEGDVLQVLLLALLFGFALARMGERGRPVMNLVNELAGVFFGIVDIVARLAPIGAFGAMGFTIGKYGIHALVSLGQLLLCVYATCAIFIVLVLGGIARAAGFRFWRILNYVRSEILIAVGTSSSEAALPGLMEKMERIGCAKPVVGIVVPAGYSFNLDGTCIYLTAAAIFLAQATDAPLTLGHQIGLLVLMLATSKGAAGITGSGFIVLAATLERVPQISPAALALVYGIDRFMSEVRTLTNFIGNTVATLVLAKWEGALDPKAAEEILIQR